MLPRNLVFGIAGLAMVGIIGGVVTLQRFAKLEAETQGPSVIAVGDGAVLLGARHELFLVPLGKPAERIALKDLGLEGPVVGVGWDGKDWFVGDDATGTLHRCDLAARRCTPALAPSAERWLRRTAKFAFAPDRIYVTDTERHRLLAFDGTGQPLAQTRTAPVALCFPNGIRAYDDGLLIADTNNHRIVWVDPAADFASETYVNAVASDEVTVAQCSTVSKELGERGNAFVNTVVDANSGGRSGARAYPVVRPGRVWPSAVEVVPTAAGDAVWVIVANDGMRDGDLLAFGAEDDVPRRMALPSDADPVELALLGELMLVTDPTNMKVHAVRAAGDGPTLSDWEPPGLREAFVAQRAQRAEYKLWRLGASGGIAFGVLLALVVVVLEKKREQVQATAAAAQAKLVRIDGAAPERITVSRADGALTLEYRWFGGRELRAQRLGIVVMALVLLAFGGMTLRGFAVGDGDWSDLAHFAVFIVLAVLAVSSFSGRTEFRLDHAGLAWTTKPVPLLSNGRFARHEIAAIKLVAPPKVFGQAPARGYGLQLLSKAGGTKTLMQKCEREQALFVGTTLADALGLGGVAEG